MLPTKSMNSWAVGHKSMRVATRGLKRFGVKPPEGTQLTITERGNTSPIRYTPSKS